MTTQDLFVSALADADESAVPVLVAMAKAEVAFDANARQVREIRKYHPLVAAVARTEEGEAYVQFLKSVLDEDERPSVQIHRARVAEIRKRVDGR